MEKIIKNDSLWFIAVAVFYVSSISSAGLIIYADADGFADRTDISDAFVGMTLASEGTANGLDGRVYAKADPHASTGTMAFGNNLADPTLWYAQASPIVINNYMLKIYFQMPAKYISIDMIGETATFGEIHIYTTSGHWAFFVWTLTPGEVIHAEVNRLSYDIAYMFLGGHPVDIHLDNLSAEILPEPATFLLLTLGGIMMSRKSKRRT